MGAIWPIVGLVVLFAGWFGSFPTGAPNGATNRVYGTQTAVAAGASPTTAQGHVVASLGISAAGPGGHSDADAFPSPTNVVPRAVATNTQLPTVVYDLATQTPIYVVVAATMTPVPAATQYSSVVAVVDGAPQLNLRYGPGRSYPIMGRFNRGDVVVIVGRALEGSSWCQIENGGWLHCGYTTADASVVSGLPLGEILPEPNY